jgi:hypothetical protein
MSETTKLHVPYLFELAGSVKCNLISAPNIIESPIPASFFEKPCFDKNYFIEVVQNNHFLRNKRDSLFCCRLNYKAIIYNIPKSVDVGVSLNKNVHIHAIEHEGHSFGYTFNGVYIFFIDAYKMDVKINELPDVLRLLYAKTEKWKKDAELSMLSMKISKAIKEDPNEHIIFSKSVLDVYLKSEQELSGTLPNEAVKGNYYLDTFFDGETSLMTDDEYAVFMRKER